MPENGFVFPYGITLNEDGQVSVFPAAEVLFSTKEGERIALFLLVDSGATISALPRSDAEVLGIEADRGEPLTVAGIGGEMIQGWKHKVDVVLGDQKHRLPIIFLDQQNAPRILGREGIFDQFTLVFQENKNRTGFLENNAREADAVSEILNKLRRKGDEKG